MKAHEPQIARIGRRVEPEGRTQTRDITDGATFSLKQMNDFPAFAPDETSPASTRSARVVGPRDTDSNLFHSTVYRFLSIHSIHRPKKRYTSTPPEMFVTRSLPISTDSYCKNCTIRATMHYYFVGQPGDCETSALSIHTRTTQLEVTSKTTSSVLLYSSQSTSLI